MFNFFKKTPKDLVKLNIGCGDKILEGYTNIDVVESRGDKKVDVICDIAKLDKFEDSCADEVLSVHVIEHFYYWEIEDVVKNWLRVLKKGGSLIIETPNLLSACQNVVNDPESFSAPDSQFAMWPLYGDPSHKDPLMCHKWLFTPESLIKFFKEKFPEVKAKQEKAQFKMKEPRDFRVVVKKKK